MASATERVLPFHDCDAAQKRAALARAGALAGQV
jgi:hypothetical protein